MAIDAKYLDELTGMYNRHYLADQEEQEIGVYIAGSVPFSLVIIDVDHFKEINDTYGHAKGDIVLKGFARFLTGQLRTSDHLVRYGGDEFICIMPNTLRIDAESIYRRISKNLKAQTIDDLTITLSVGIASFPEDGRSFKELFDAADRALYDAKRSGRDRIGVHGERKAELPIKIFVDRLKEKDEIRSVVAPVEKGIRIAAVAGSAGIGKTRLSKEVLADVRGKEVIWCDCMYFAEHIAYYPIREIIKYRIQRCGPQILEGIPRIYKIELGKLVPDVLTDCETGDFGLEPVLDKYRLYESVRRLLEAGMREKVIIIDNTQWIDGESLEVIKYLMRSMLDFSVSFIFLYRPEEKTAALEDFMSFVSREVTVKDIMLPVLKYHEIRECMKAILGNDPDEPLLGYVSRESGGNPFYIEEVIRGLLDGKYLVVEENAWRFNEPETEILPKTVTDIVVRNYRMLNTEAQKVLEIASVIGWFDVKIIGAMTGYNDGQVMGLINDINRLGLVKYAQEKFMFSEAISQRAIYQKFVEGFKAMELHRQVAEQLKKQYPGQEQELIEELALHSYQARDKQQGVSYCQRAGDCAKKKYAVKNAVHFYSWALELLEQAATREESGIKADLLLRRALVHNFMGDYGSALSDLEAAMTLARETDDVLRQAKIKASRARYLVNTIQYQEAQKEAEESLALYQKIGDPSLIPHALLVLGNVQNYQADYEKSLLILRNAQEMLSANDDPEGIMGDIYFSIGKNLFRLDDYDSAMDNYEKALDIFRAHGKRFNEAQVLNSMGNSYLNTGDNRRGYQLYEEALHVFLAVGSKNDEVRSRVNMTNMCIRLGEYDQGLKIIEPGMRIAREIGDIYLELYTIMNAGRIFFEIGDHERSIEYFEDAMRRSDAAGLRLESFYARLDLAEIHMFLEDNKKAWQYVEEARVISLGSTEMQKNLLPSLCEMYLTDGRLDDYKSALAALKKLLGSELPEVIKKDLLVLEGRYNIQRRDYQRAEECFRNALAILEKEGEKPRVAHVYYQLGLMELAREDKKTARDYFTRAIERYRALGARGWQKKAEKNLSAIDAG